MLLIVGCTGGWAVELIKVARLFFLFGLKGWVHGDAGLTVVERTMDFGLLKGAIRLGSDTKLM